LLLDRVKALDLVPGCLFRETSPFKSSEAVVKELGTLLLPSYGDLMRPLKHLKYEVEVHQHSIQEFDFKVENLAIDLRDGVRLTRIVETILGEINCTKDARARRGKLGAIYNLRLTDDLKFPCISRTQRLHNAKIALAAIQNLPSVSEGILKQVTPIDIVDGHREKTLSLLWALLGQYSMDFLVDWDFLKQEIATLRRELEVRATDKCLPLQNISDTTSNTLDDCGTLLLSWAQAINALHNISVANLTTSFADATAFNNIITTYVRYFANSSPQSLSNSVPVTLQEMGCSESFIALLTQTSTIPSKAFTTTSLTFLAARLFPAAKTYRAATIIQVAYRRVLARREVPRRVALMRLATHCAAVVMARDRVIRAATVLQRTWRRVLNGKILRLESDVCKFQAAARGWIVRRKAMRGHKGRRKAGW